MNKDTNAKEGKKRQHSHELKDSNELLGVSIMDEGKTGAMYVYLYLNDTPPPYL